MTVTSVIKNPDAKTMTITARFHAPISHIWQVRNDPRQPERWPGPPTYRAPRPDTPTAMIRVALSELAGGGTQMDITTAWAGVEAMEQMLAMGTEAGMTAAVGPIDELLGLPARA